MHSTTQTLDDLIDQGMTPEELAVSKQATSKSWQQVLAENPHLANTGLSQLAEAEAQAMARTQRQTSSASDRQTTSTLLTR